MLAFHRSTMKFPLTRWGWEFNTKISVRLSTVQLVERNVEPTNQSPHKLPSINIHWTRTTCIN
jgi:hypothetical protein